MKSNISLDDYEKVEYLGQGTYGIVYKAKHKNSNQIIAVKNIKLDKSEEGIPSTTMREISLLRELAPHPHIINLKAVLYGIQQNKLNLVFQFAEFDLKKYLTYKKDEGLSKKQIKSLMYQLVNGVFYCHSKRIIHRDLKPQNILISEDKVLKIADFGLARVVSLPLKTLTHQIQTLWYRAPQVLLGQKQYNFGVDIWAVGCIFAQIIQNQPLFKGDSQIDQLFKIFKLFGTPTNQMWPNIRQLPHFKTTFPKFLKQNLSQIISKGNQEQIQFLELLLQINPLKRLSMKNALKHQYFDQIRSQMQILHKNKNKKQK